MSVIQIDQRMLLKLNHTLYSNWPNKRSSNWPTIVTQIDPNTLLKLAH